MKNKTRRGWVWCGGLAARRERGEEMLDLLFVGVTIGFFLLAIGYVRVCERLR